MMLDRPEKSSKRRGWIPYIYSKESPDSDFPPVESPPASPTLSRSSLLTCPPKSLPIAEQKLDNQASQLIVNAPERSTSLQPSPVLSFKTPEMSAKTSGSFSRMSFNSMIGSLSSLALSRSSTSSDDKERGRSQAKDKGRKRSSSVKDNNIDTDDRSLSRARARSQSPFSLRRFRSRDPSPTPQPLPLGPSDVESSDAESIRPRSTSFAEDDSENEGGGGETEDEDSEWSDGGADIFDPVTEANTERNAVTLPTDGRVLDLADDTGDPDPLGEGQNVIVPPEPYFPSTLNSRTGASGSLKGKRGSAKRKKSKHHEPLPCVASRPIFQRDRCTINVTQGDPDAALAGRKRRRYVVASDLSEESRYAIEWGIGTVLRDGDEMLIVTVVENEGKVDPSIASASDRTNKLRCQQERQGLAYILVRRATALLQRTKLNVVISCQAWHAKNARHMLLDIVDYNEPTMLIVGSRGLGQLTGILLGSTSHYLIQRCSVPVMVARRRLKRPPKRSAHLSTHRTHVSLAEAGIDRVAARVDQDVAVMRDEIQRDDERRDHMGMGMGDGSERMDEEGEGDGDADDDGEEDGDGEAEEGLGKKVAGES